MIEIIGDAKNKVFQEMKQLRKDLDSDWMDLVNTHGKKKACELMGIKYKPGGLMNGKLSKQRT